MMEGRRVVITGLGAVTPIGNNVEAYWDSLKKGVCGIDLIQIFDTEDLPVKVAGLVKDFNPADYGIEAPFARRQDRFTVFAVAAANQAIKDSGIKSGENIEPFRFGVYMGSGIGGFSTIFRENEKMVKEGPKWIAPTYVSTMIANIAGGNIAIRHNATGPCLAVTAACATSSNAIGEAYRAIKHGYADAIIAGGSEASIIPIAIAGFANAKALSRCEDPNYASIPFNANRAGFVLSEGSAALILEEYDRAVARGAHIYAEICGYGHTCDAFHVTAPNPTGETQAKAMKLALDEAWYNSSDILHINAHGTGTVLNDPVETKAIKLALGDDAYKAHINSTKSMMGHLLGAAGAVEAVATILALQNGIVPPTINLDCPDPECDLDYTPNKAVEAPLTIALSNSMGFGGHNAAIAFRKVFL